MDKKEIVLKVLKSAGKPMKAGEIAELAGMDKKETDKAMNLLKSEGLIESPIRCYWQPCRA